MKILSESDMLEVNYTNLKMEVGELLGVGNIHYDSIKIE